MEGARFREVLRRNAMRPFTPQSGYGVEAKAGGTPPKGSNPCGLPRLEKLRRALAKEGLDAVLITQPENRRYLSGFTGSAGVLLLSQDEALLATDFRYYEQAEREAPYFQLVRMKTGEKFAELLPDLVARIGAKRVGFESKHLTFDEHERWKEVAEDFELVPTKDLVEEIRAIKEEGEIEIIKKAVSLSDEAFAHILGFIQPGMTERDVAWEIEVFMRTHGAGKVPFEIIVASGPNSSMPHATTTERVICAGEPIIIDMGAMVEGYNSNLTRTILLGQPDEKFNEIYELVLKAQLAAEEGIRPGMTGEEADEIARGVIEDAGYGERFGHGLGHGVGLAVHEKPTATKKSKEKLKPGMVFTVEPGIYIPGWGGVRIEDMVLLTEEGVEVLTQAEKLALFR
jgi:Xaa-Pro aminopeptidase